MGRMRLGCIVLAWLLGLHAGAVLAQEPAPRTPPPPALESTDRIIVRWRPALQGEAAKDAVRAAIFRKASAVQGVRMQKLRSMDARMEVMHADTALSGDSLQQTLEALRADPNVEYAVPDRRRHAHALPSDPMFAEQWFLQEAQVAATRATTAWDTTTGNSALIVAVLDTGVRFEHPDLQGKLLAGYDFVSADNGGVFLTANDGDGRDTDASDPGDWINSTDKQNSKFSNCDVSDSSWHGTRVSGIIAAATDNAVGVAGIAWHTRILPVRVLGKCGGYDSDIIDGMRWAAGIHVAGVPDNADPAQVVNLSLGAKGPCTAAYTQVIGELAARGVLVVASAGNVGGPVDEPANCNGALGVAGLRQAGTKVGYSSLGAEIGISAPAGNCGASSGVCLYSLDTTTNQGITAPTTSSYTNQINPNIGTSFSAPIVSGIAALMRSVNSKLTTAQLVARLQSGSTPFPSRSADNGVTAQCLPEPQGSTVVQKSECVCTAQTCGAGMANAAGAVSEALRPFAEIQSPGTAANGQRTTLDGSQSFAAQGHAIAGYSWSQTGIGTIVSTGPTAAIDVPASGIVTVQLTVTDDAGKTDSASVVLGSPASAEPVQKSGGGGGGGLSLDFLLGLTLLQMRLRRLR
jgi:serine protease